MIRTFMSGCTFLFDPKVSIARSSIVAPSSIVHEVIRTISSLPFFFFFLKVFLRKDFEHKKRKLSQNQPTKQKKENKKQQRQQFFSAQTLLREGKLFILRFLSI